MWLCHIHTVATLPEDVSKLHTCCTREENPQLLGTSGDFFLCKIAKNITNFTDICKCIILSFSTKSNNFTHSAGE